MESRICKQTIYRLVLEGLVIIMLFGLVGCGSNKNKSAEDIAEIYLKRTYNKEFVVEELTKKDAGPFKTKEYSGYAYEKDNPESRFKVWVNKDSAEVTDAYYSMTVLPKMIEWIQAEADSVWDNVKVGVVLDVIRPTSNLSYKEDEYLRFLETESLNVKIYLILSSRDDLTVEKYELFDNAISKVRNGVVHIYVMNNGELLSINVRDFYDKTPDISISVGAPSASMKEKFQ